MVLRREGLVSWRRREQSYCVIEAWRKKEREAWEGRRWEGRKSEGRRNGRRGGRGGKEREGRKEREGGRGDKCWCYKALFLMLF